MHPQPQRFLARGHAICQSSKSGDFVRNPTRARNIVCYNVDGTRMHEVESVTLTTLFAEYRAELYFWVVMDWINST